MAGQPYRRDSAGLSLFVRVTPNGGRDAIEGVEIRDDGRAVLRLRVRAVPDKGKANAAAVTLLSRTLGVPKSAMRVTSGETSRMKTIAVAGNAADLAATIESIGQRLPPA